MSIEEVLKKATLILQKVTQRPRFESEILLCHFLNVDRIYLRLYSDKKIDSEKYLQLVLKRATNYPLEYITKNVTFYDISLYIDKGVLIPRPETEQLVDESIKIIKKI